MGRTTLGRLTAGTGALAFLIAFLMGTLAPALVGLLLLGIVHAARQTTRRAPADARRKTPEHAKVLDEFRTTLTIRRPPTDAPLHLYDEAPDTLQVLARSTHTTDDHVTEQLTLRARESGLTQWTHYTIRTQDPWGFHDAMQRLPLSTDIAVAPEDDWASAGRRIGRRRLTQNLVRRRLHLERMPEIEGVREWLPGDSVRDIDWKRTSRMQRLMTRERERAAPKPILVLLDARAPMRWRRRTAKITSASRTAYGIAGAARGAGVRAQLVAFSEAGVVASVGTSDRRILNESHKRLSHLAPPRRVHELPIIPAESRDPTRDERPFLLALAPFIKGPAPAQPPLDAAVAHLTHGTTQPGYVVATIDGETDPRATIAALNRLAKRGHRVLLVAPAGGPHHWRRQDADAATRTRITSDYTRRQRLRHQLQRRRIPMVSLRPGEELYTIQEVAEWAR